MFRWALVFFAALIFPVSAAAQTAPELILAAKAKALHLDAPSTPLEFDTDGKAKAIVADILKHFGILTVDWDIYLTEDKRETANAIARFERERKRRIIVFNKVFMREIIGGAGRWAAYSVAAHECGHHVRNHLVDPSITVDKAELEADWYSGLALGYMGATYDEAVAAINWFRRRRTIRHVI